MNTNTPIEFDYNVATLSELAQEAKSIDKENIDEVKEATKLLVKARGRIQKQGKSYRDEAIAHNKRVLANEKALVEIIEPIESEYKELIKKHEHKLVLEARRELLPMKKAQLKTLEHRPERDDEFLMGLDDEGWVAFFNGEFELNEKEKIEIEERKAAEAKAEEDKANLIKEMEAKAEQDKQDALKKAEEDKEKAVVEERMRLEREKQAEADRIAREAELEQKNKEKIEADAKYQEFLTSNNHVDTDLLQKDGNKINLYRLVATYEM